MDIELLKKAKKEKRLSYDDLARLTGYSRSTITNIFLGYIEFPRHETIQELYRVLGIEDEQQKSPPSELTEGEKKLIELFNRVPVEKQEIVLQMLRAVLDNIP